MDKSLSASSVLLADSLPVRTVRLPLKYPEVKTKPSSNQLFHNTIAVFGGIVNTGNLVDCISYTLLNDLKTLKFTPVALSTSLSLEFHALHIVLPHCVSSSSNISVHAAEEIIIVDFIDENNLFISLTLHVDDFVTSSKFRLSIDNFAQWGHISVPYSFELRSTPYSVSSVDLKNVIVSLKDGGLLHFRRPRVLQPFDVYNFTESHSFLSLNVFSSFSKHKDVILDGISASAAVDAIAISPGVVASLSVTKVLKVWSLETHSQVSSPIDLNNGSSVWLTSIPAKYLRTVSQNGVKYLIAHSTDPNAKLNVQSGVSFKVFEISESQLLPLDKLAFVPEIPVSVHDSTAVNSWLVQDYRVQSFSDFFRFYVLWKSNTSSRLVFYDMDSDGAISSVSCSHEGSSYFSELSPQHDTDFYCNKILNSGTYNELVVTLAINIFREHANLDAITNFNTVSLRLAVFETVQSYADPRNSWYRLDLLCQEFQKLGSEALGLALVKNSILSVQANGLEVFRPSHYYESFAHQKINTPEGQIAELLNILAMKLSTKTYSKLYHSVSSLPKVDSAKASELYATFLSNKISDDVSHDIMTRLESIPDALNILESLIECIQKPLSFLGKPSKLSVFVKLFTIASFRKIKFQHETILLNLLVLFLICEANSQIVLLINKVIEKLSVYSIFDLVLNTSFTSPNGKVESSKLSKLQNCLFWPAVVDKNESLGYLVKEQRLNEAFDVFHASIIGSNYNDTIVNIVTELINHNEGALIKEKFFENLNSSKPIDAFLKGLVHLINNDVGEFFEIFADYTVFEKCNTESIKNKLLESLASNKVIIEFLEAIFSDLTGKVNYYHSLSQLAQTQSEVYHRHHGHLQKFISPNWKTTTKTVNTNTEMDFLQSALDFEKVAIDTLKESGETSKLNEYYFNVFDMALKLSKYDVIYEALENLNKIPRKDYKLLFTRYVHTLVSSSKISVLFPPNKNDLYRDNYLLIDSILLNLANSELSLASSLKSYEYLYSWRLFGSTDGTKPADRRGAIEALYLFITRFRFEQKNLLTLGSSDDVKHYNLKILEVYIIILNCLKSFSEDDDKWILSHDDSGEKIVVKMDQISLEYYEWLKLLESEMV